MSITGEGVLDPNDALRMLDLALNTPGGHDIVMSIENAGAPIEGESLRQFEDGKPRMDVAGYYWGAQQRTQGGLVSGKRALANFIVVRRSDAATASIASLLRTNAEAGKVTISAFKAGGDVKSAEQQPTLEFVLEQVRVHSHFMLSGGALGGPTEIIAFAFRRLTIRSARQKETGARGALRECMYDNSANT